MLRPMRDHARLMRRAPGAGPPPANGRGHPCRPDAAHGARMPLHGGECHVHTRKRVWRLRHGPCGPMRGPCGSRLARARCGPTREVGPAARTPREWPACRCMGAHAMSPTRSGSALLGPCGPMRGPCGARLTMARRRANGRARPSRPDASHGARMPLHGEHMHPLVEVSAARIPCGHMRDACEARLAWARCGPSGEVIPAARAPRLGPACRCMAGAPASIAALADAFVVLLSTTRVHVWSGHVNTKRIRFDETSSNLLLQQPPATT